jgi:hypothetical protein
VKINKFARKINTSFDLAIFFHSVGCNQKLMNVVTFLNSFNRHVPIFFEVVGDEGKKRNPTLLKGNILFPHYHATSSLPPTFADF